MKSITIHKLDDELGDRLAKIAQRDGLSLNQLVKQLLRKAVGLDSRVPDHRAEFADLFGTWSDKDAEAFNRRLADLGEIDSDDWQIDETHSPRHERLLGISPRQRVRHGGNG